MKYVLSSILLFLCVCDYGESCLILQPNLYQEYVLHFLIVKQCFYVLILAYTPFQLAKNFLLCPLKLQGWWTRKLYTTVKFIENDFLCLVQYILDCLFIVCTCLVIQNDAFKIGAFQMNSTIQRLITRNQVFFRTIMNKCKWQTNILLCK